MPNGAVKMELAHLLFIIRQLDYKCRLTKAHDLYIYEYIKYILSKRPSKSWTDEQFETIAPWNQDVIDSCKR